MKRAGLVSIVSGLVVISMFTGDTPLIAFATVTNQSKIYSYISYVKNPRRISLMTLLKSLG